MDEAKAKKVKIIVACMMLISAPAIYMVLNRPAADEPPPPELLNAPHASEVGGAEAPTGGRALNPAFRQQYGD